MFNSCKCSVRLATFSDGERYPLLIDGQGLPLWYPTLFTTTQVRNASKAPNTMAAVASRTHICYARKTDMAVASPSDYYEVSTHRFNSCRRDRVRPKKNPPKRRAEGRRSCIEVSFD